MGLRRSLTLAHQSEQVFALALLPIVNPLTLETIFTAGFVLSRYSSCWVGFKAISETVESSASIVSDPHRIKIIMPDDFETAAGRPRHSLGRTRRWTGAPAARPEQGARRLHARQPFSSHRASCTASRRRGSSAPGRPARPISISGRLWLFLGITDAGGAGVGLARYRSHRPGRWKPPAPAHWPRACRMCLSSRRSAVSSRISSARAFSTPSTPRSGLRWSASATRPARRCCEAGRRIDADHGRSRRRCGCAGLAIAARHRTPPWKAASFRSSSGRHRRRKLRFVFLFGLPA